MDMTLSHYSDKPITLNECEYNNQNGSVKPKGLWVSVDGEDDWLSWCKSEEFRLNSLVFRHEVKLHSDANVLTLSGSADLIDFTRRYGKEHPRYGYRDSDCIQWQEVSKQYDAIIIAPYCWHSRLELAWYYGWDCASGCIWNLNAIQAFSLVEAAEAMTK